MCTSVVFHLGQYALRWLRLSLFGLLFAHIKWFIAPRKSVGMPKKRNSTMMPHLLGHNSTLMTIISETLVNILAIGWMDKWTDTRTLFYNQLAMANKLRLSDSDHRNTFNSVFLCTFVLDAKCQRSVYDKVISLGHNLFCRMREIKCLQAARVHIDSFAVNEFQWNARNGNFR